MSSIDSDSIVSSYYQFLTDHNGHPLGPKRRKLTSDANSSPPCCDMRSTKRIEKTSTKNYQEKSRKKKTIKSKQITTKTKVKKNEKTWQTYLFRKRFSRDRTSNNQKVCIKYEISLFSSVKNQKKFRPEKRLSSLVFE